MCTFGEIVDHVTMFVFNAQRDVCYADAFQGGQTLQLELYDILPIMPPLKSVDATGSHREIPRDTGSEDWFV